MSESESAIGLLKQVTIDQWREDLAADASRNKLIRYWPRLLDNVQYSTQRFYTVFLEKLHKRQVPDLEVEPILLRQSGLFSPSRLYLQLRRERFVFEICAAPFGNGFFCSERLYDRRREARWYHCVLVAAFTTACFFVAHERLDTMRAGIVVSGLVCLMWSIMRLSLITTLKWLEDKLYDVPLLGPIYQTIFHPDTYFRQDQNACYAQAVRRCFMETIDGILEENGLKGLSPEGNAHKIPDLHKN